MVGAITSELDRWSGGVYLVTPRERSKIVELARA
jgi:hypothetical protein